VASLRDLVTESKYLKREFGEPLPTFNGVMKQHQVNKLKEDWWSNMSANQQAAYKKAHPKSQQAQDAKDKDGSEPEDKPFGGDTGKDADYGGGDFTKSADYDMWSDDEPESDPGSKWDKHSTKVKATSPEHQKEIDAWMKKYSNPKGGVDWDQAKKDNAPFPKGEPKELEKGAKVTAKWTGVTGDEQSIPDGEIEDTKYNEDGTVDSYNIRWNNGNNLINLSADKVKGEEPEKAGRTGKELSKESFLTENPAAAAAAAMATVTLLNKETGRKNKAITALRDKDNPSHGKAVGIFQKLRDKFKKSDFDKEKDKVAKGADAWVKKHEPKYKDYTPSQSDTDFYRKQYAARTGKELGEDKMNESIKFHTITGNKRFMTKTALKILRKHGVKNVKVHNVAGDFLEIRFPIDSNKLKKLDKELKRKNKTAYGGIVENRRDKMTEDILRKVIREEIKRMIKEDEEAFSQPIPAQIDRYMRKFIDAVTRGNLNRKRKLAILGRTIVALRLDPQEVSKYARLVKREL
jgi:hypothetical protein